VNRRTLAWGGLFILAGGLLLANVLPGSDAWALGPRLGLGTFLLVAGLVMLVASFAAALQRRTAKMDGKGGCPVGATCGCGHFNFKPRPTCRQCGAATRYTEGP
jgi:hypothetical protein